MASNLIPMLSSSPPPMDENGSFDDEDDDFGDFTCAGGVKVLDSPLNSPVKSNGPVLSPLEGKSDAEEKKGTWNEHVNLCEDEPVKNSVSKSTDAKDEGTFSEKIVVFSEDVEEFNCDEEEMDFGEEKQGLSAKYAFTHSELHDNTSQESVTDSGLCSSSQRSETSPLPPGEAMFPELSPETETEEVQETFPEDPRLFYLKPDLELSHPSEEEMTADSYEDTTTPVNEPQSFDDSLHVSQTEEDFQEFESCSATAPSLNSEDQNTSQSMDHASGEKLEPVSRTDVCDGGDGDEFADFASAQFDAKDSVSAETCDDSFADFSQVSFDNSSKTEDSDWANFASSEVVPQNQMPSTSRASQIPHQFCALPPGEVHQLLGTAFPGTCEDAPDSEQELLPVQPILGNESSHSCLLWRRLEDLDRSVSLQYQWTGSHSFQRTLQALNIDSRNVAVAFQEGIPPAQFDWSSSGLVNPLDPSQSNSTLLDLDFFTSIDTSPSSSSSVTGRLQAAKASSLEQELLGMDPMCGNQSEYASQTGGKDLVQKLLMSVPASSMTGTAGPGSQQLSAQAAGLVSLLPDMSFMQAKVLMFPIRDTLES